MVGADSADGIDMIFALLKGLLDGLQVWDGGLEPYALLGMRPLVWRNSQEHLNCCTRWSVAGRFCKKPLLLLRSLELSFSKRAG